MVFPQCSRPVRPTGPTSTAPSVSPIRFLPGQHDPAHFAIPGAALPRPHKLAPTPSSQPTDSIIVSSIAALVPDNCVLPATGHLQRCQYAHNAAMLNAMLNNDEIIDSKNSTIRWLLGSDPFWLLLAFAPSASVRDSTPGFIPAIDSALLSEQPAAQKEAVSFYMELDIKYITPLASPITANVSEDLLSDTDSTPAQQLLWLICSTTQNAAQMIVWAALCVVEHIGLLKSRSPQQATHWTTRQARCAVHCPGRSASGPRPRTQTWTQRSHLLMSIRRPMQRRMMIRPACVVYVHPHPVFHHFDLIGSEDDRTRLRFTRW